MRFHFIDGLRAVAALLIVFQHSAGSFVKKVFISLGAEPVGIFFVSIFNSGVELFFVLSGVVLLRPFLRKEKNLNLLSYFKRRFTRIYPTYFVAVLFATILVVLNTYYPNWYSETGFTRTFTAYNFLKQFFIFNQNWDYYNLAWWSLQIEILFYLLCPILIFTVKDFIIKIPLLVEFAIVISISLLIQYLFLKIFPEMYTHKQIMSNLYRGVDYIPAFYLGTKLAKSDFKMNFSYYCYLLAIILLSFGLSYPPAFNMGFSFLYAGILNHAFNSQKLQAKLSTPIMIWLGERSYSLFLIHFSVFYLVNYCLAWFLEDRSWVYGSLSRSIGVTLAFLLSMLLFWLVERKTARNLITANKFWPTFKKQDLN